MSAQSDAMMDGVPMEPGEIEIARIDLRYVHTRIMRRESLVSLAASIDRFGQLVPVITVPPRILIDGYRRVAALKLCRRDTVLAEQWKCTEEEALVRVLSIGCERRWESIEQAALVRELIDGFKMSQAQVARQLCRDPSWVARRLSLIESLPEELLEKVRSGRLSSWSASRVLAPLARANASHAAALGCWVTREHVSSRDLADFFNRYKSSPAVTRERMIAEPSLFLKALRIREQEKEDRKLRAGPEGRWLSELTGVVSTLRRLTRRAEEIPCPAECVLATLSEAARLVEALDHEIRSRDDPKRAEGGCTSSSPEGNGNPSDQPRPQGIEEHRPQGAPRQE